MVKIGQAVSVQRLRSNPSLSGSKSTQPAVRSRTAAAGDFLCAWPVAHNEWRVQSRLGAVSKYLRSGLKLPRCAWAVCGGHLVIFKLIGTKADAQRVMRNATRQLREISTERAFHDLPRSGVFID
jgi:hypothetical protein